MILGIVYTDLLPLALNNIMSVINFYMHTTYSSRDIWLYSVAPGYKAIELGFAMKSINAIPIVIRPCFMYNGII